MIELPIDTQFRLLKDAGVFDYFARLPTRGNLDEYVRAMQKYQMQIEQPTWYYMLGRDEQLLLDNIDICREVGARHHNIMTFTRHSDGHVLTDDEILAHYISAYEYGASRNVEPSFELHVNMWTEEFLRVSQVATRIRQEGVPFNFTMDYSHVTFKIGNDEELKISGVLDGVRSGDIVIDPFEQGSLCDQWLDLGIVRLVQFRTAGPNQPMNLWAKNEDGSTPRGIQYPITRPRVGEWHSEWHAYMLEPSKEAIRKVLRHHAAHEDSRLRCITTEMIDMPDYGLGARYDLLTQNIEAAKFIRKAWAEVQALTAGPSNARVGQ
jgi:hypothetical protein